MKEFVVKNYEWVEVEPGYGYYKYDFEEKILDTDEIRMQETLLQQAKLYE